MGPTTRSALGKIYLLSSSILFGEKGCGMYQGRVGSQAKKLCGSGLCGIPSAFRGKKKRMDRGARVVISTCKKARQPERAMARVHTMLRKGVMPNTIIYNALQEVPKLTP